jgi:dihydroorotate dehydrogenase (fumarate)
VLPSLFEEELTHAAMEVHHLLETGADSFGEAASYFPELGDWATGPERYLDGIRRAKESLSMPVIGSLNGVSTGGWIDHARLIEEAGADALELNLYRVAADPDVTAVTVEREDRDLVARVCACVSIPVAVKLSPYYTALAHTARELVTAGADGLVLFNRFYQPDLDVETLAVEPHLTLSTSEELRLPLRWIAILHGRVDASLAASSGVHTGRDVAKALLAGADVVMLASALLERGAGHLRMLETDLLGWMEAHEYASVAQLRGSVSQRAVEDPAAFERANYLRTLRSYSSPLHP